jgi:hypothetical protein
MVAQDHVGNRSVAEPPERTAAEDGTADSNASSGRTGQRRRRDQPFEVHVEFVVLDGEAGAALARH